MNEEIWKDVPNYEGHYSCSNLGNLKSIKNGVDRPLSTRSKNNSGYFTCSLVKDGKSKKLGIHVVVAISFLGDQTHLKKHVNHKNKIKTDNRVENLEWVSVSENIVHSRNNGAKGKKFTIKDCIEMIKLSHNGMPTKDIAIKYNTSRHAVSALFTGLKWPSHKYPEIAEAKKKWPPRLRHIKHNKDLPCLRKIE